MLKLWLRHDIEETGFAWYTGTGTPSSSQMDAWSVWQEETGHAQNMDHWNVSDCTFTMSGCTDPGTTGKRQLTNHTKFHACDPYRRVHGTC